MSALQWDNSTPTGTGSARNRERVAGVARLFNLRNRHAVDDSAGVQHGEAVAQLQDGKQVMGDIEEGGSMAADQLPQEH